MKKVLPLSVLNILYNRINMDPNEFVRKNIDALEFMVHKSKSTNKIIRNYHGWIKGANDAIERGYVRIGYNI